MAKNKDIELPSFEKILSMSEKAASKELSRLKPIALGRLKRIKSAGKEGYLKNLGATFSPKKSKREELANISQFLRKPFSKLSNINKFEKDMLNTLHNHGYDIEDEDIKIFNEFMGEVKAMYKGRRIPDSDRVVEAFIEGQRLKMSHKALLSDLDYWREHLEDLKKLKDSHSQSRYSANYIKNRINKLR